MTILRIVALALLIDSYVLHQHYVVIADWLIQTSDFTELFYQKPGLFSVLGGELHLFVLIQCLVLGSTLLGLSFLWRLPRLWPVITAVQLRWSEWRSSTVTGREGAP